MKKITVNHSFWSESGNKQTHNNWTDTDRHTLLKSLHNTCDKDLTEHITKIQDKKYDQIKYHMIEQNVSHKLSM